MAELVFERKQGVLVWGAHRYSAISGPHGKGPMPKGEYVVRVRNVVTGSHLSSSYRDIKSGDAWFIPLEPQFGTSRSGFGIHPDGNVPGTLGCVGIKQSHARSFWRRWMNTPMSVRPTRLIAK